MVIYKYIYTTTINIAICIVGIATTMYSWYSYVYI